jgi:hypothetical protein
MEIITLMKQLRRDERRFYIYFRMTTDRFDEVLSMIEDDICKMDTNYQEATSPEEHLAIGLRYEQNQYLEWLFISSLRPKCGKQRLCCVLFIHHRFTV